MPPEYDAPGVYVDEIAFRSKTIEGASTSTAAFIGPTRQVPDEPFPLLTTFTDFARAYGCAEDLRWDDGPDYLAQAVRAYFNAGGRLLYVAPLADPTVLAHYEAALTALLALRDVAIVAAPAAAIQPAPLPAQVGAALIAHAETSKAYRFAIIDPPPGRSLQEVQDFRATYDSSRAALYYPWVMVADVRGAAHPVLALPPSGFLAGLYARNDDESGVWKAPANMAVPDAMRFERDIAVGEQAVLNPLGVNCLRFIEGRGFRVWGARTLSSDPEFKYVNVRRLLTYLEASLNHGLRWAVFEPNADQLWGDVRQTVEDFLYACWRNGALLGQTPAQAFFVRCGLDTMTADDVLNGRLICQVGVAPIRPAEFMIFRTGHPTASAAA